MNANLIRPSTVFAQKTPLNTDSTKKCCHREAKRIVSPTSVRWLWLQKRHLHSESCHNKQSFLTLSNIKLNLTTNFTSWKGCCRRLGLELPWQGNSAQDHLGPSKAKWKLIKEYLRIPELGEVCFGSEGIWCRNIKSLLGPGNMNDHWSTLRRTMPTLLSEIVKRTTWTDLKLLLAQVALGEQELGEIVASMCTVKPERIHLEMPHTWSHRFLQTSYPVLLQDPMEVVPNQRDGHLFLQAKDVRNSGRS